MIILTPVVNWERVPVAEADTHHALVLFPLKDVMRRYSATRPLNIEISVRQEIPTPRTEYNP
jgi:hypothetical protein